MPPARINKPLKRNSNSMRRVMKQKRKQNQPQKVGHIEDLDLMTVGRLRKRLGSPMANISISAKKKNKMLKRIGYDQERAKLETESKRKNDAGPKSKKSQKKSEPKEETTTNQDNTTDVEMKES